MIFLCGAARTTAEVVVLWVLLSWTPPPEVLSSPSALWRAHGELSVLGESESRRQRARCRGRRVSPWRVGAPGRQRGRAGTLIFTALVSPLLLWHHIVTPLKYPHPTGEDR